MPLALSASVRNQPTAETRMTRVRSEQKLQTELDLAGDTDDTRNGPRVSDPHSRIGQIELRRVKEVEEFGAKLDLRSFRDGKILEERKIEVHPSGSVQNISPGVTVGKLCGRSERGHIKPPGCISVFEFAAADAIRTARSPSIHVWAGERRGEGESALRRGYAIHLPSAQDGAGDACVFQWAPALAERNLIVPAEGKTLPDIERRIPSIGLPVAIILGDRAVHASAKGNRDVV